MSLESLLIGALLAAALLPLAGEVLRSRAPSRGRMVVAAVLLLVAAAVAVPGRAPAPEPPTDRPIEVPVEKIDYVTSRACRSCHPREHATWQASYHRTMTRPATPEHVRGARDRLEFTHAGMDIRFWRRGDELWTGLTEHEAPPGAEAPRRIERPLALVTGSHHLQVLWFPSGHGRALSLHPMAYHVGEARWLPLDAAFLMPPDTRQPMGVGRWNQGCIGCHTTGPELRLRGALDMDTRVAELGISCEACHGPGAAHVAAHRDPRRRYAGHLGAGADDTIVQPERLPSEESAEVCGQCHSVSVVRDAFADEWREEGMAYRPGDDLDATRLVVTPERRDAAELRRELRRQPRLLTSTFWPDGVVRINGREYNGLLATPCFTHGDADRRMTCLTCHRMHQAPGDSRPAPVWADDQLAPGMRGDRACVGCHVELAGDAARAAHTHHGPDSPGSRCMSCHMSPTTWGLLKATRSHTIESPRVQTDLAAGRPNACNQCHLDRTLAWTADRLRAWYGVAEPELDEDQRTVAAGVLWTLRGDAGQRALMAWSMGWEEAQRTAGTEWMAPWLAELMRDPYHAVRFVAQRSWRSVAGLPEVEHDFMADEERRDAAVDGLLRAWSRGGGAGSGARPELLLGPGGLPIRSEVVRLLRQRDLRPVFLAE